MTNTKYYQWSELQIILSPMRIYPLIFDSMLIFKISRSIFTPYIFGQCWNSEIFTPYIFLAMLKFRKGKILLFWSTVFAIFVVIVSLIIALVVICYCSWYNVTNTCLYNNTYHNAKETSGTMLTNGKTYEHHHDSSIQSFTFVWILTIGTHCFGHLMRTCTTIC